MKEIKEQFAKGFASLNSLIEISKSNVEEIDQAIIKIQNGK